MCQFLQEEAIIVKCANTMLSIMALMLLSATIVLGFASGLVTNMNEVYDDPEVYAEAR